MISNSEMLRREIEAKFDLEELRSLCYDLGIPYDDLAGNARPAKVVSLLRKVESEKRLWHLRMYLRRRDSESTVSDGIKDREQFQTDQVILENAELLQTSVRELDEELSDVLGPLSSFDPNWEQEKLDRFKEKLIRLANKKEQVRRIQDAMGGLDFIMSDVHDEDKTLLRELLARGRQLLYALSHPESAATPFPNHDVLTDFLARVRQGIDADQAEEVRQVSRKVQSVIDEEVVRDIHQIYLKLRQQIRRRWQS